MTAASARRSVEAGSDLGRGHHTLTGHVRRADLVVLRWPRPATSPRHLLQTAHTLLKPSGLLANVVHVPAPKRAAHLTAMTGAAHNTGFHPVRHVVAIVPVDDDTPDPPIPSQAAYPHTELLIFQPHPPT